MYCSVVCYKEHQVSSCTSSHSQPRHAIATSPCESATKDENNQESKPLRPLTSLNWPYVPEESAYPDPLKRDDPKPLQLSQYEAIATSPAIRRAFETHPRLPSLLKNIDRLRGPDREDALQHALGVNVGQLKDPAGNKLPLDSDSDIRALRQLAEAVEAAVRGGKEGVLGLDWGE